MIDRRGVSEHASDGGNGLFFTFRMGRQLAAPRPARIGSRESGLTRTHRRSQRPSGLKTEWPRTRAVSL